MTDNDVDIELRQDEPIGDVEMVTVQSDNRLSIPERFLEYLGLNHEDNVAIICKERGIEVVEGTIDKINKVSDEVER